MVLPVGPVTENRITSDGEKEDGSNKAITYLCVLEPNMRKKSVF